MSLSKCVTKYCKRKRRKHSTKCYTCLSREYRKKNPFRYSYQAFKDNAKRRGKEFLVTYQEYVDFGLKHHLFRPDGTRYNNMTIDRLDCTKGYHVENMQVLTCIENSRKRYVEYFSRMTEEDYEKMKEYEAKLNKDIEERRSIEVIDDCPF